LLAALKVVRFAAIVGTAIVFCGLLVLVAGATVAATAMGPGCWLASGGTLSVMVLTVTWDFGTSRRQVENLSYGPASITSNSASEA